MRLFHLLVLIHAFERIPKQQEAKQTLNRSQKYVNVLATLSPSTAISCRDFQTFRNIKQNTSKHFKLEIVNLFSNILAPFIAIYVSILNIATSFIILWVSHHKAMHLARCN